MSVQPMRISTPHAPAAVGPYAQAQRAGDLIFTAGQIALDPQTPGKLIVGGIKEQTQQVIKNLSAILEAADSDLSHVIKTTVYMVDLSEFAAMNEIYAQHFGQALPARATLQAAALPLGARLEIEAIALVK